MSQKLQRLGLALAGSVLVAAAVYLSAPLAERGGWPVYDFLQRQSALTKSPNVTFVVITQGSLDELRDNPDIGLSWPWPRELYGAMAKTAGKLKAKSVTYDIEFGSSSLYGVEDDRSFNAGVKQSGVPVAMVGADGHHVQNPTAEIIKDLGSQLHLGVVTIPQEIDGIYRRMDYQDQKRLPLGFAISQPSDSMFDQLWLRFYAPGVIKTVEASEVFHLFRSLEDGKALTPELQAAADKLKDSNWIVGAAAPGLLDLKPTPVDPYAPGPILHATAMGNALDQQRVIPFSPSATAVASIAVSIFAFVILLMSSTPVPALVGASLVSLLGPFLLSLLLWQTGVWVNPVPMLICTGVLSLIVLGVRFQLEWRERQRLAKTVENAMSADMVELVRKGEIHLSRFGERREISIFFCDMSGFTTVSENLEASMLVDVLNLYFNEVVNMIFDNKGFVDKFIGDAVMAIWGAPAVNQTDHAKRAVESAVQFSNVMQNFRTKARALIGDAADELTARAGVHTGVAIVGHIGSQSRHNYTAIGDSVNLASRLEGIGKQYDTELLVSEDALIAAQRLDDDDFVEIDIIAVKGRSKPTRIFTHAASAPKHERSSYRLALTQYRRGEFAEAAQNFEKAPSISAYKKMGDRCRAALANGVPASYRSGVWHFDEK